MGLIVTGILLFAVAFTIVKVTNAMHAGQAAHAEATK